MLTAQLQHMQYQLLFAFHSICTPTQWLAEQAVIHHAMAGFANLQQPREFPSSAGYRAHCKLAAAKADVQLKQTRLLHAPCDGSSQWR